MGVIEGSLLGSLMGDKGGDEGGDKIGELGGTCDEQSVGGESVWYGGEIVLGFEKQLGRMLIRAVRFRLILFSLGMFEDG